MNESSSASTALSQIPPEIHCAADYERVARQILAEPVYEYIAGGSGEGISADANRAAFNNLSIYPRMLRNVSNGNTQISLLDKTRLHPLLLAPIAFQKLAHPQGEMETARAAAATATPLVCSTLSSFPLEAIAQNAAGADCWLQLYFQPKRETTLELVRRAAAAGYRALMVTLDAPIQLPSLRSRRAGFVMPDDCRTANLQEVVPPQQVKLAREQSKIFQGYMSEAPTWEDLSWLQQQTELPILAKGVLHPDDARRLQKMGIAAIVVSNHGGRALDGAPASLRMLPVIREAVGDDYPLLFDGGIRSGGDIFKALAMGANAVMIGRLQMYALGVAGALGVAHMLRLLRDELEVCMALAGCAGIAEISPSTLLSAAAPQP